MSALACEDITMDMQFVHEPVLMKPVLELAAHAPMVKRMVDCTVGGAGHATALLEAFPEAELLGIDRDPTAVRTATERLSRFGKRARVVHGRFSTVEEQLQEAGWEHADLVLADFGVSSHQLDHAPRGFSFRADAALDMRMDPTSGATAAELIAEMEEDALAHAIKTLGEERFARRVARALIEGKPTTTAHAADIIRSKVPKSKDRIDPATRTFQALRMLVNRELDEIESWLKAMPSVLADNGVALAISFHSLEDRAVKLAFRLQAKGCMCPPHFPVCACGHVPTLRLLTAKARQPDDEEVANNPRARSSRVRAAQRLARTKA